MKTYRVNEFEFTAAQVTACFAGIINNEDLVDTTLHLLTSDEREELIQLSRRTSRALQRRPYIGQAHRKFIQHQLDLAAKYETAVAQIKKDAAAFLTCFIEK